MAGRLAPLLSPVLGLGKLVVQWCAGYGGHWTGHVCEGCSLSYYEEVFLYLYGNGFAVAARRPYRYRVQVVGDPWVPLHAYPIRSIPPGARQMSVNGEWASRMAFFLSPIVGPGKLGARAPDRALDRVRPGEVFARCSLSYY